MDIYGQLVRAARLRAGKRQCDLAKHLRITTANVSQVERGRRGPFRPSKTKRLARYLAPHADAPRLLAAALLDPRRNKAVRSMLAT